MLTRKHLVDDPVNILLADFRHQGGDNVGMFMPAKYPNRLGELIAQSGLKQAEVARRVGTSRQQIHALVAGDRELTLPWARRIAEALNLTPAEVLGLESSGLAESPTSFGAPAPHPQEYDRLPDQVRALTDALRELGITLPAHAVTRHAQAALAEASRMDRRAPFEERARIAAEAKAADIARSVG